MSAPAGPRARSGSGSKKVSAGPRTRVGAWLARPMASFHLIVTIATLLTVLGLVMVLSASSVEAYADTGSAYGMFTTQLIFAVLGVVLFYVALCTPVRLMRKLALPAFVVSVVMLALVLVPGIGKESGGARRWFELGGLSFQPSELAKVTLVVWGASVLATRRPGAPLKELLIPLVPGALLASVLVILQPNYSTTVTFVIVVGALLWFAGLPLRIFGVAVAGVAVAGVVLALSADYRAARIFGFLNPGDDPQGANYQSRQAKFSLADGGLFGRGLGQSRAKWSYLPNAHNDFIFAIIGEELGFIGCVAVLGLFALFVFTGLRIAMRSVDPFLRLLTAAATTWILAQAMINIGYVIGLLPVTGQQLPLVSAGGTSTAITLLMFGILANAARHEPEAVAALHSGPDGRFARLLRLPKPEHYSAARAEAARKAAQAKAKAKAAQAKAVQAQQKAAQAKAVAKRRALAAGPPPGERRRPAPGQQPPVRRRTDPRAAADPRRSDPRRDQALSSDERLRRSSGRTGERGFRR
ncbi:cell division protein FtsW [Rhodococcus tukisamuensis]|uniref:Probable peptidoglycan glycosyltransferase FtsW n=2 Tax=Rhodococcus tukisamuensis TaxID=168276 RepID=A0A1G7BHY3_9NOCA|nr:putative lipid II flippase FtsW [Rhodococcus tukisamuensis]SDE26487.1 cell division protein FtsW [Rhodococcus tukisamuensis]